MDNSTVGIELLCRMAAVISELFDQVFITLAQLVLGTISDGKRLGAEMLNQVLQQPIREAVLVRLGTIAENALEHIGIGTLNFAEGFRDGNTDILGYGTDILPMSALGDDEAVVFFPFQCFLITILGKNLLAFFIVHIADALEEQKWENILLVSTGINIGTEQNCGIPQVGLQFFNGDSFTH